MRFLLFLFLPFSTWAAEPLLMENGGSSFGNGGHSVRCFLPEKMLWSNPESLDLYEGRQNFSYQYPNLKTEEEAEALALSLARKLDLAIGYDDFTGRRFGRHFSILAKLRLILRDRIFVNHELNPTNDSKFQTLGKDCELRQTINFGSKILVNKPLWDEHSLVDKSALLLHEAIYWYLRNQGKETDSRRVRRIVSFAISGNEIPSVIEPELKKSERNLLCRTTSLDVRKSTELFATIGDEGNLELHFRRLGNYRMLSRSVVKGPAIRTALPLDRESLQFSGELVSVSDRNSFLDIIWDSEKRELKIRGLFEGDYPIAETLKCAPVVPSDY